MSEHVQKPMKVLSTTLGIMLAGHLILTPSVNAEGEGNESTAPPKLIEWSTEEVKSFFNPDLDWNLPFPEFNMGEKGQPSPSPASASSGATGGSAPIIANGGGGFGWDDLLLYHLIFNSGRPYSSSGWVNSRPVYNTRTNTPYQAKTYDSGTFQNKPRTTAPSTSSGTGSFTTNASNSSRSTVSSVSSSSGTKSSSSSPGSIGGKSGGFSSSSSSGG